MIMFASTYITHGVRVASFTTPNAKSRGPTFSLSFFSNRTSLDILSTPTGTTRLRHINTPISAVNSGLEASTTDSYDISAFLTDVTVVSLPGGDDQNKIQLRVDLTGDQTQKVFDKILINLGRTAPPVPGFRMQKGGKSSKIPKHFLVQMLGEERVTKFAIQEILNCTMADYAKKENLDAKDKKVSTVQTEQELKKSFKAGKRFSFNVMIEPNDSEGK
ncbi:bacterial trigger factor [Trifolium repens]|nr:bacterial trigger factor [Trifolium repens]